MSEMYNRMCVITVINHKEKLESWVEGLSADCVFEIANENYNLTAKVKKMFSLATDVVVIDDAILEFGNNEEELISYVGEVASDKLKVVFIGGPKRKNKDELVKALLDANITSVLLTRYFDNNELGAKALLREMILKDFDVVETTRILDQYQEQRSGFFNLKEVEPLDILFTKIELEEEVREEDKVNEFEMYKELFGNKVPDAISSSATNNSSTTVTNINNNINNSHNNKTIISNVSSINTSAVNSSANTNVSATEYNNYEDYNNTETQEEDSEEMKQEVTVAPPKKETTTTNSTKAAVAQTITETNSSVSDDAIEKIAEAVIKKLGMSMAQTNSEPEATNLDKETKASFDAQQPKPQEKKIEQMRFAVAGCTYHVGTTHFALSLAFAIKQTHADKQVCVAMTDSADYERITQAFNKNNVGIPTFKDVDFLLMEPGEMWPEDYHYCIADTGLYSENSMFNEKGHRRYLLCGGNPWDLKTLVPMFKNEALHKYITWCFFGASSIIKQVFFATVKAAKVRAYTFDVPYDDMLFDEDSTVPSEYKPLFTPVAKRSKPANKKGTNNVK